MLGWESMQNRRTMRKLCLIQQILVDKSPSYLYKIIEKQLHRPNSRLANRQQLINIAGQTNKYKKSFFPSTIVDWNNIDFDIKTSKTKNIFKKRLLNKIRPKKKKKKRLHSSILKTLMTLKSYHDQIKPSSFESKT